MKKFFITFLFLLFLNGCMSEESRTAAFNSIKDNCNGTVTISYTVGQWGDSVTSSCSIDLKK